MIETRLTRAFALDHPVISAPMARAAGGKLAAAVTRAGGLGLIGGAYCDAEWIEAQFGEAGNEAVGCGLITWALADRPGVLEQVLARKPRAIFLSFGNPAQFAGQIAEAGVPLICQVQTLRDARQAADLGAAVIVAQGAEAGGHGESRATMTLVPEAADMLARAHPGTLLVAAGGIADGRGLAAALMLGADGVLMGSRLWASDEALVSTAMQAAAVRAGGDDTIRSTVMDVARRLNWPGRYTCRVLKNAFTDRWHGRVDALLAAAETVAPAWVAGWEAGDPVASNTFVGEAAGLIDAVRPAGEIVQGIVAEAEVLLGGGWRRV
ncbi:MAG: nitronate monooxygenase [Rhodobacter sp.]|nr:nitronate monooxygenase [Rhodobacter sp.]